MRRVLYPHERNPDFDSSLLIEVGMSSQEVS